MIPRSRIRIWTHDGIELASYTGPSDRAEEDVRRDLAHEVPGAYATVTPLEGGPTIRIEQENTSLDAT